MGQLTRNEVFTLAVQKYSDAVYRAAIHNSRCTADAEDVVQDVYEKLLHYNGTFESEEHLKAWLLRVAAHCAADVFRAPWRKRDLPLEAAAGASAPPPEEPDGSVLAAVLALPEKYRLPVHLFYYEGYSIQETAAILGRRESTVRTQLTRARAMLRERLEAERT